MDEIAQTVFCMWAGVITLDYAGVSEELLEHVRISFLNGNPTSHLQNSWGRGSAQSSDSQG